MVNDNEKQSDIQCPVYPLGDFTPIDPAALDEILAALPHSTVGRFETGAITPDRRLDMCKQALGPIGCQRLSSSLNANSPFRAILLGTNGLGDEGAVEIARASAKCDQLRTLYLGCNGITAKSMHELGAAVENGNIEGLWLKRNPVGDAGVLILSDFLERGTGLKILDLTNSGMTDGSLPRLVDAICSGATPLERVYLGCNQLGPNTEPVISRLVSECKTLKGLFLSGNPIGTQSAIKILGNLRKSEQFGLVEIGLGDCNLCLEAVEALCCCSHWTQIGLGRIPAAKKLNVIKNEIGDAGADVITTWLPTADSILQLDLNHCQITTKGTRALIAASVNHPTLVRLRLDANDVSSAEQLVLQAMHKQRSLKHLDPLLLDIKSVFR